MHRRVQADAKKQLHEMMKAPTKDDAMKGRDLFEKTFENKYPKAVACLRKSWDELTEFFNYPAAHWISLRTTNPIESSFATVKLRTKVTKGAGSRETATAMAFKLLIECQKRWRSIRGSKQDLQNLLSGVVYRDGIMIAQQSDQEAAAS